MNDFCEKTWREGRPEVSNKQAITFCLDQLLKVDRKHTASDLVTEGLTFEELIGALLVGEDLAIDDEHIDELVNELVE